MRIQTNISSDSDFSGVYLAYPTTPMLKRTYRNHTSLVNNQHTKVGITVKSFRERSSEYYRTFDGELEFVALLIMPPEDVVKAEPTILSLLKSEFSTVGRTREWFDTSDRKRVIELIQLATGQTIDVTY